MNMRDLSHQHFGKLEAIEPTDKRSGTSVIWKCNCSCGKKNVLVAAKNLINHNTQSCGCLRTKKNSSIEDLTNRRFGNLVAKKLTGKKQGNSPIWQCKCDCGNEQFEASAKSLLSQHTRSCGCLIYSNNVSGCRGVSWHKNNSKWVAYITIKKKHYYLGDFDSKIIAIRIRHLAEKHVGKNFEKWYKRYKLLKHTHHAQSDKVA